MCQNQGQAIYTRSATTRIVAIKLDMPNPFFALALGLVHTSEFLPGEMGAGATSFHSIARAHAVVVLDKN